MEVLRTRLCEWQPVEIDALALAPASAAEPRLAVGRAGGSVELWDTTTWHLHSSAPGCKRRSVRGFVWVASADADADGQQRLLSAGLHTEITEWELPSLRPLASMSSGGGAVWALCVAGGRLLAACDDGSIRIFSLGGSAGELSYERRLNVGRHRLLSAAIFGDDHVFVGGSNSLITKWSLSTYTCEAKMKVEKAQGAETLIWALVSLGKLEVASGDSLGLVHIWDPIACTVLHRFAQHQADVLALSATPDGDVLLSASIDTKISTFVRQHGGEERWVFRNAEFAHTHDIRAVAVKTSADGTASSYVSGGVTGKLLIHKLRLESSAAGADATAALGRIARQGRPRECSGFSPAFHTACVAEDARLLLGQRGANLELWYLQPPKDSAAEAAEDVPVQAGKVFVGAACMPEPQLLLRVSLTGSPGEDTAGLGLTASAISSDGHLFAASDSQGLRLFHLRIEDLEVRRETGLPDEVRSTAARSLLFYGAGLLAVATWHSNEVWLLNTTQLSIEAKFPQHRAPVSHLAATAEWLASADVAGATHIFNLDSLQHHARVPVGEEMGFPTAISFDSRGRHLITVLSTHEVLFFDVEAQTIAAVTSPRIPPAILPPDARVCGIVAPSERPDRVLFWGHTFILALDLTGKETPPLTKRARHDEQPSQPEKSHLDGGITKVGVWTRYPRMQHILAAFGLDRARWGRPVLEGHVLNTESGKRVRSGDRAAEKAMLLTLEVTDEAIEKAMPQAFERKSWKTTT
eukprot:CAMPEP_0170599092 /NCGR_PEP_ID=MMETSP0224-20130122/16603_1 /TAXON_ID=285029 /ORGANISM="Togula jolla, Strain CCCM 725" /LENGTH=750 /DNA_ID=CAMNT_0010923701 /DNA_START=100 /DNA_END=2352 /DNA_ORIENTATION=+